MSPAPRSKRSLGFKMTSCVIGQYPDTAVEFPCTQGCSSEAVRLPPESSACRAFRRQNSCET